jgi:hypothetical protein
VLLAGMICAFADRRPTAAPATERPAAAPGRIGNGARAALWALFGLTLLSLLVHSRLLTRPVLLFTMLPATLDWMCYAVAFTLVLRRARADDRAPALLSGALIAGAAWVALAGAREYGESVQAGFAAERVKATFFSENFTAGFLALSLPVAVARFLDRRAGLLETFALGAVAVLTCGTLVATGSRLGVIAAVAGLAPVVLAGLSARGVFPAKRAAGLLLAALVLAWGFRGPLIGRVSGGGGAAAPSAGRRRARRRHAIALGGVPGLDLERDRADGRRPSGSRHRPGNLCREVPAVRAGRPHRSGPLVVPAARRGAGLPRAARRARGGRPQSRRRRPGRPGVVVTTPPARPQRRR